ncbi:MAG: hypothetical protein IJR71_07840 [Prevotella sp.]|nr:hypothetical protein [Prevotella sp.]
MKKKDYIIPNIKAVQADMAGYICVISGNQPNPDPEEDDVDYSDDEANAYWDVL